MKNFRNADDSAPMILNFGGGVDSTAILIGLSHLYAAGDKTARPDLILFADTGDELPETYENVNRMNAWCATVGFPEVTIVSRPNNIPGRVGYKSLSENCVTNETLPSEAFGRGACAGKWKHDPMDAFLFGRKRPYRMGWMEANGHACKPVKLIGYNATEAATGKRGKHAKNTEDKIARFRYPLIEWNWTRQDCVDAIAAEGLPTVIKSACSMCPNQSEAELRTMAKINPSQFLRALAIEEIAKRGKHGLTKLEGLWRRTRKSDGRSGSWVQWAKDENLLDDVEKAAAITLEALIAELKPEWAQSESAR